MNPADRAGEIKRRALALGFDLVGIATARPPGHSQEFQQWLASGFHGEMGYMAKTSDKRVDPTRILADARSVVVVGLNYFSETPREGTRSITADGADAQERVPPGDIRPAAGRIARYAWGARDYHDVMDEKLKRLAAAISESGEPGTRSLWYVDTGPVLERDLAQRAGIGFIVKHTNLINRRLGNWIFVGEV